MMMGWKAVGLLAVTLASLAIRAQEVMLGPGPGFESDPTVQTSPQAAAIPPVEVSEELESQLRDRVLARWQTLIRGDFDAAYLFETPAYRAIYTPSQFRTRFGNQTQWVMAKIKDIRYDDLRVARVRVKVDYRYAEPSKGGQIVDMTHEVNDVWLRKEGQWWRHQD